jgi:hypothetical protein
MFGPRKRLCLLPVLGVLVAGSLSGCAGAGEPALITAVAKSGIVNGVIAPLKEAEDARDVQWLRENAPHSQEESAEARERAEAVQTERANAESAETSFEGEGGEEGEEG